MYLTLQQTSEYLDIEITDVLRLMREKQVRYLIVDDEVLFYKEQFNLFLKEKERYLKELADYLNTPLPKDIDVKDED